MSRPTYAPKQTYVGTGSLAVYTFDFKIEALSQLLVVVTNVQGVEVQRVRGDDTTFLSTVVFDSMLGGGTVTLLANLTSGYQIVLLEANDAPTQPYEYSNKSSFNLKSFEMALDFVVGAVQRLAFKSSQTVRISDSDDETTFNPQLPAGIALATTRNIRVNSAGTGLEFGDSSAESGSGKLPDGGDAGAVLLKNSSTDGDADWDDLVITGFSSRFNTNWSSTGLRDFINQILQLTYVGPLIASFTGSSNTLREKGASVSSVTLSVNVTMRSNPIARIRFLQNTTVIADDNPPSNTGSGTTTATYSTAFSDNITFTAEVTDTAIDGGPSTVTANVSYAFVYPYYHGCRAPGATAAQVAALTKDIMVNTATTNKTFTSSNGDVYYFAYPAAYAVLTSILDANGFENIGSFTKTVANITGLDGNAVSYNIYASNNPVVAGSTNFTFKQ